MDVQINHGELVFIIGDVGSGKSSLLSALSGDLLYVDQSKLEQFNGEITSKDDAKKF